MKKHLLLFALLTLTTASLGGLGQAQNVQEAALIHSLEVGDDAPTTFPTSITVKVNQPVRLFNIAADSIHAPVIISRDQAGTQPVFGVEGFLVETGKVAVVEFTPNETGEFFITHRLHGHDIIGKLVVTN